MGQIRKATLLVVMLGVASLFQNCGKVNFVSSGGTLLTSGTNQSAGLPPPPGCVLIPASPTPTPPTGSASPTPTPNLGFVGNGNSSKNSYDTTGILVCPSPSASPVVDATPTPTPPTTNTSPTPPTTTTSPTPPTANPTPTPPCHGNTNTSGGVLCYLTAGPGQSQRIGSSLTNNVMVLDIATAIPHDACMSVNACLVLINSYLNHTAGDIAGHYGPAQATMSQYTSAKYNGVCAHNPNVQHLTDAQITQDLMNLQLMHQ